MGSKWKDTNSVIREINNNPGRSAEIILSHIDQSTADLIYSELMPTISNDQKKHRYERMREEFVGVLGMSTDHSTILDLDSKIADLTEETDIEPV